MRTIEGDISRVDEHASRAQREHQAAMRALCAEKCTEYMGPEVEESDDEDEDD